MVADLPLPNRRRSLFAVWHWPWWNWAVIALLMLIVYPLSLGPVLLLINSGYVPWWMRAIMGVIYFPLELAAQIPAIHKLLDSYIRWWV